MEWLSAHRIVWRDIRRARFREHSHELQSLRARHEPLDEYESLALKLAEDRGYLEEIRGRLAMARDSAPLFDSTAFTKDLEALYLQIAESVQSGSVSA